MNVKKFPNLRTNLRIMKRVLIISTVMFALIDKISGRRSPIDKFNMADFDKDTQVCDINLEHPNLGAKISSSGDLRDFVSNSKIWVDKSLLANKLIEYGNEVVFITAPQKWGKTLNLDMLRYIFEKPSSTVASPETNFARQFFIEGVIQHDNGTKIGALSCKPLISTKTDFINRHFQKYPVLYLDFKNITPENWRSDFQAVISDVYRKHSYLLDHFHSVALGENKSWIERHQAEHRSKKFSNYMKKTDDDYCFLQYSIVWLCQNLYKVYGEKCVVFIDEFDVLQNKVYLRNTGDYKNGTEAIEFMRSFGSISFRVPTEGNIKLAVLMRSLKGTYVSGLDFLLAGSDLSVVQMMHLAPFFGFTPSEVETIIRRENPNSYEQSFAEASAWYGGYASLSFYNGSIFNPWAIMRYIETFTPKPYWNDQTGSSTEVLIKLLNLDDVEEVIYTHLLESNDGYIIFSREYVLKLERASLENIHKALTTAEYSTYWHRYVISDAIVSFMCQTGYLSVQPSPSLDNLLEVQRTWWRSIPVIIPNVELKSVLQNIRINSIMNINNNSVGYMQALHNSVDAFADWFQLDVDEPEDTTQGHFQNLKLKVNDLFANCRKFAYMSKWDFSNLTREAVSCYQNLNEAAVRRTMAPVLEKFRQKIKSTFIEKWRTADEELGKLDTQVLVDGKLSIIEYRCDSSCNWDKVLEHTVNRTLFMMPESQKYKWIKFLAINVYQLDGKDYVNVDLGSRWMNQTQVEKLRSAVYHDASLWLESFFQRKIQSNEEMKKYAATYYFSQC